MADMSETLYSKGHDSGYDERGETDGSKSLQLRLCICTVHNIVCCLLHNSYQRLRFLVGISGLMLQSGDIGIHECGVIIF